jgi:hypothetical protein
LRLRLRPRRFDDEVDEPADERLDRQQRREGDGQTVMAAGTGPRLFSVATAETMHVITIDSTRGATTMA